MSTAEIKLSRLIRAKFRVKIKSLADEARTIRQEERRIRPRKQGPSDPPMAHFYTNMASDRDRGSLRGHRTGVVRSEQRHTLLARAFLLGQPCRLLERKPGPLVNRNRVTGIIKSLAGATVSPTEIDTWLLVE